jgi:tetratricopeptide (TPR) repeat protein
MPPERPARPFTELLDRTITEQSRSLAQVAKLVDKAAEQDGQKLATTKQQVYRWRHGPQVPEPQTVRWLAVALNQPVEEFAVAAHRQRQLLKTPLQPRPTSAATTGELIDREPEATGPTGPASTPPVDPPMTALVVGLRARTPGTADQAGMAPGQLDVAGQPAIEQMKALTAVTGSADLQPTRPSGWVAPAELPHGVADFTGRAGELAELRARLFRPGGAAYGAVLAIDGPPGVGKSALAVHLAHQVRERFPDAQLFADLRGEQGEGLDPIVVVHQFLRALGVASEEFPPTLDAAARAYRSRLAGARALIVLDNALDETQARPLLPGSPTCATLLTSRRPLSGLAEATSLTLELLPPADAARMLARAAGNEQLEGSSAASAVAAHCGYLPLALRIAGARLRTRRAWTAETLASLLADERHRLGRLAAGDLAVRASFSLSYQGLDPGSARVFRMLGLLEMPELSTGVAAALTGMALPAVEAALEQLVDAALLEAMVPGRYRLHDLVRLFARERAEDQEPADARRGAVTAAVGWYLGRVVEAAVLLGPAHSAGRARVFPDLAAALEWLEAERENLVRAVTLADAHGLIASCWQLADGLFRFYELRRYLSDWQQVNETALRAARRVGDRAVEGRMHNGIGYVYAERSQFDVALEHLEAALAIRDQVGDRAGAGRTLKNLGDVRIGLGQPARALDCYQQAVVIAREVGDRHREGQALHGVGVALTELGQLAEAEEQLDQALGIRREVSDQPGEGRTRFQLANVRRDQGRYPQAQDDYEASLAMLRAVGDRYHEGIVLWQMGVAAQRQGAAPVAHTRWRQALAILDAMGGAEASQLRQLLAGDQVVGDQAAATPAEPCA